MGLLDKISGTRRPAEGVVPRPAEEVRAALLAVNRPEVPYLIREGEPDEGVDLVAELNFGDQEWNRVLYHRKITTAFRIVMRLDPDRREVRALDQEWQTIVEDGVLSYAQTRIHQRGQQSRIQFEKTISLGADGQAEVETRFRLSSSDVKDELRHAVTSSGWVWRGVVLGKL
jgi:hypothetical protein